MCDYKLYILHEKGHIVSSRDFEGPDDSSAMEESKKYSVKGPIEVWRRARFVARIDQGRTSGC